MDALAALLDGPRARRAFVLRAVVDPPFGVRVEDGAPLTVVAILRGTVWVRSHGRTDRFGASADDDQRGTGQGSAGGTGASAAVRLDPGDLLLARGPAPYTVADTPDRLPNTLILPGNVSTSLAGDPLCTELELGVRTWGTRADGATAMLIGTYPTPGAVGAAVLDALPALVALRRPDWDCGALELLAAEAARAAAGQDAVIDRLLDVVLVAALRAWFAGPRAQPPGWYRGGSDPVVGPALRALHEEPAAPWTLERLATRTGTSRATLARRFTRLVGRAPMAYLTGWRLALAADLLAEPGATVAGVSRRVGYATPFAFSAAFKRERGVSPSEHRLAAR